MSGSPYGRLDDIPADAKITHVTTIPYRGERVVLPYKDGKHSLPETDVAEGETAEAAIKRVVFDMCGIQDPKITHLGHFIYKATTLNKTLPAGTIDVSTRFTRWRSARWRTTRVTRATSAALCCSASSIRSCAAGTSSGAENTSTSWTIGCWRASRRRRRSRARPSQTPLPGLLRTRKLLA